MGIKPRSVMLYGISGSTKTSQAYFLAKHIIKTTGKKIRMIHSDGGGWAPFADSGMIERGEVEIFDYSCRQFSLSDWRKLSQGFWPRKLKDGKEYFKKDQNCLTTLEEWEKIGGYIIEGMSSAGEVLKCHCSNQTEGVGFKESWRYTEEEETIVGLQMGHYDLIQKEIHDTHLKGYNNLPIPWLIYTSLLGKATDKKSSETVFGPQVCGNAATPQAPQWFVDCLHLDRAKYTNKTGQEVEGMVAWFQQHPDSQTGVPCLAKARVLPEMYPRLLEYFPFGFCPLSFSRGIVDYFMVLEKLRKGEGNVTST